jgi:hypothetical protein
MEEDGSFGGSVVLDWLMQELANTPPASTQDISERCPPDRFLGVESDTGLRMRALARTLAQPAKRSDNGVLSDPRMREIMRQLLEKLLLAERRMSLGPAARGVDRFKLYRDGEIGEYCKLK